jgi:hypothetical protein
MLCLQYCVGNFDVDILSAGDLDVDNMNIAPCSQHAPGIKQNATSVRLAVPDHGHLIRKRLATKKPVVFTCRFLRLGSVR